MPKQRAGKSEHFAKGDGGRTNRSSGRRKDKGGKINTNPAQAHDHSQGKLQLHRCFSRLGFSKVFEQDFWPGEGVRQCWRFRKCAPWAPWTTRDLHGWTVSTSFWRTPSRVQGSNAHSKIGDDAMDRILIFFHRLVLVLVISNTRYKIKTD